MLVNISKTRRRVMVSLNGLMVGSTWAHGRMVSKKDEAHSLLLMECKGLVSGEMGKERDGWNNKYFLRLRRSNSEWGTATCIIIIIVFFYTKLINFYCRVRYVVF